MSEPDDHVSVEIISRDFQVLATVNGFEVASSADGRPKAIRASALGYLVEGENTFEVQGLVLPAPPDRKDDEPPWLECSLHRRAPGADKDVRDLHANAQVDPSVVKLDPTAPTTVLRHRVHMRAEKWDGSRRPHWDFEKSPPMGDRLLEARELVQSARAAAGKRDLKSLAQLFSRRFTELALADDLPRDAVEGVFLEHWGEIFAAADVSVDGGDFELQEALGGRVYHARARGGRSPVVVTSSVGQYSLGVSLAVIDGAVRIIR